MGGDNARMLDMFPDCLICGACRRGAFLGVERRSQSAYDGDDPKKGSDLGAKESV